MRRSYESLPSNILDFHGDEHCFSQRTINRGEILEIVERRWAHVGIQVYGELCDIIKKYEEAKYGPTATSICCLIMLFAVYGVSRDYALMAVNDEFGMMFFIAMLLGFASHLMGIFYWPIKESKALDEFLAIRYKPMSREIFEMLATKDGTTPREFVLIAESWKN